MNTDNKMDYFIGLDIGTNSVGYAVTDSNYKVLKVKDNALWGARLFDEAETAADRRLFRTHRRNLLRKKHRIEWLQGEFRAEVSKIDPLFFDRLNESSFKTEDKEYANQFNLERNRVFSKDILFNDKGYSDKDFFNKYKTIYHLKLALLNNELDDIDVRELYLAIAHFFKHRGHFLYGDLNLESINFESDFAKLIDAFKTYLEDKYETHKLLDLLSLDKAIDVHNILKEKIYVKEKKAKFENLFGKKQDVVFDAIISLLSGSQIKLSSIIEDLDEDVSFSFKDFEDKANILTDKLGDTFDIFFIAKGLYDFILLEDLRKDALFISESKVKSFNKHKEDLALLKKVLKDINCDETNYNKIFNNKNGYNAYVGYSFDGEESSKKCSYTDFAKNLDKVLNDLKDKEAVDDNSKNILENIIQELKFESFLPLQKDIKNSAIPYQLNKYELEKILENASQKFTFLNDIDISSNLSLKDRIIKMFEFRIPYFVGPLCTKSEFSWCVRKDDKIYPWNFSNVVNLRESAEKFIERMQRSCTYLKDKCLPKDSLLYQKFSVLNEINNIKINGVSIDVDLKQKIYNELFLKKTKVTQKALISFLKSINVFDKDNDILSGFDGDFKSTLRSHIIFKDILSRTDIDAYSFVEDIIARKTYFPDDTNMIKEYLDEKYKGIFNENERKLIINNKFKDFGNLSRSFLEIEAFVEGHQISIIEALWFTNFNLMQLLSNKFDFMKKVNELNNVDVENMSFSIDEFLSGAFISPAVKRSIYQTYLILQRVKNVLGNNPKRVFIEVAKGDGVKERTVSRKKRLEELYKASKNKTLLNALATYSDDDLKSKKLYLYFEQNGKCMYTNEEINLNELDSRYDIDHIYPYSKSDDDSIINNKVLVVKSANARKSDSYPIDKNIQDKMRGHWYYLYKNKFISQEKYERLIRTYALSDEELASFISRQLVETRQSTKIVGKLVELLFDGETEVVYSKAKHVSNFRNEKRVFPKDVGLDDIFDNKNKIAHPILAKCRDINDLHHAKDAYLNIVVGNVYHTKFTKNFVSFIQSKQKYSLNRVFDFDVKTSKEVAWIAGSEGSIKDVLNQVKKNNINISYRKFKKKGQLTQDKVGVNKGTVPFKEKDPRYLIQGDNGKGFKYGGYKMGFVSYFIMVKHNNKQEILPISVKDKARFEQDKLTYVQNIFKGESCEIVYDPILINSSFVLEKDGKSIELLISGKVNDSFKVKTRYKLVLEPEWTLYVKKLFNFVDSNKKKDSLDLTDVDIQKYYAVTKERNIKLYAYLIHKIENSGLNIVLENFNNNKLKPSQELFNSLDIFSQAKSLALILKFINVKIDRCELKDLKLKGVISFPSIVFSKIISNSTFVERDILGFCLKKVDFKE